MNAPLYETLKKYAEGDISRFFMPSHAGRDIDGCLYKSSRFDFTELSFSDNLVNADGVILKAETLLAKSYDSPFSLMFTSGATSAIWTALATIREYTDEILIDSFSHKSVFCAAKNFNFKATIIQREFDGVFPKPIDCGKIDKILSQNPSIKAVSVTSPDYFGNVSDVEKAAKVAHSHGAILFVDEAQGAHFVFSPLLPKSANGAADIVCDSMHKTMPVYGGGAVLNLKEKFYEAAKFHRARLTTSSPSYIVMASMDYARGLFDLKAKAEYEVLKRKIDEVKSVLGDRVKNTDDFTRLVIKVDGDSLEKEGIYPEASWGEFSVFIVNFFNANCLSKLTEAVKKLPVPESGGRGYGDMPIPSELKSAKGKREYIPLAESEGRISADDVGSYPPGVPLIYEGEIISGEKIKFLSAEKHTFNLVNGKICVIIDK
ncbi:orn/Lys/Arg decarboxylase major region [Acidaminococcus sp. CAG:917]|nr:orn/Lys/Arg decarboxylase major region [Acidaminococcus sp. CAG:917]